MILDLTKESDKYLVTKFPDGQQNIVLSHSYYTHSKYVKIKSRFNSFLDLELIICSVKALKNLEVQYIELYIPYVLGARSDRKFSIGGTNYLSQVVAPILNNLGVNKITALDPHSDVMEACIDNLNITTNQDFIDWIFLTIPELSGCNIISPDNGAAKKIYNLKFKENYELMICSKHRELSTGKILEIIVPQIDNDKPILIIDDICDGGGTFIGIAEKLREAGYNGHLYLAVTHGIFSNGLDTLTKWFSKIFCTNSIQTIFNNTNVIQQDIF